MVNSIPTYITSKNVRRGVESDTFCMAVLPVLQCYLKHWAIAAQRLFESGVRFHCSICEPNIFKRFTYSTNNHPSKVTAIHNIRRISLFSNQT